MKVLIQRLDHNSIHALLTASSAEGFPYELTEESAARYCRGKAPANVRIDFFAVSLSTIVIKHKEDQLC